MNWSNPQKTNAALDSEQVNQVIAAILAGKYSWACVLMLRFIGHDPLHYIPYRTYNRLLKEQLRSAREIEPNQKKCSSQTTKILDLKYVEAIEEKTSTIQGGLVQSAWMSRLRSLNSIKSFWKECS